MTPEGYENVYDVSGWSENVLTFIEHTETPMQVIDDIGAIEPVAVRMQAANPGSPAPGG